MSRMQFEEDVALWCGLRESVLATFLWDMAMRDENVIYRNGKYWTRISQPMITVALPVMTVNMVRGSLRKLKEAGVIRSANLNHDRFDHTNWYAFTEYGEEMMAPCTYA